MASQEEILTTLESNGEQGIFSTITDTPSNAGAEVTWSVKADETRLHFEAGQIAADGCGLHLNRPLPPAPLPLSVNKECSYAFAGILN